MVIFKKEKEKKGKAESKAKGCAGCGVQVPSLRDITKMSREEQIKKLKELEKHKVKSVDCPYLETCDQKMLPNVGQILCLDLEIGQLKAKVYALHLSQRHAWEECIKYAENLRRDKGILPRNLKKALKETKEK